MITAAYSRQCKCAPSAERVLGTLMNIEVDQHDWGGAYFGNICDLLDDVAGQLTRHFEHAPHGQIRVRPRLNQAAPFTPYRQSPNDPYVIEIPPHGQFWFPYIF